MNTIRVNLGPRSYDITIGSGESGAGAFARERAAQSRLAFVVADANVTSHADGVAKSLAEAGFTVEKFAVPAGEASKSLASTERMYERLAQLNADRKTVIVAVGGGVVGDLAGFVAATYNRGLPLLMIPTTLLAMVDSSVGGKVGVNLPQGKNLVGAFQQPIGVWVDSRTLDTLPAREFRSGLAEVVKYGTILDADFFCWLEDHADTVLARELPAIEHVIARCCRLKADVVENDEREETGLRMILNYGHTFAHAFETAGAYSEWLHGEAVAAGMVCASRLAERLGLISAEMTERQIRLLSRFGLPTGPKPWPAEQLVAVMRRDKKAQAGKLRFILPRRIGEAAVFDDVPESDVTAVLREPGKSKT
jgi:3-dehydroquinate synthase